MFTRKIIMVCKQNVEGITGANFVGAHEGALFEAQSRAMELLWRSWDTSMSAVD